MATVASPRLTSLPALSEYRRQLLARPRAATVVQVCGDTGCRAGGGAAVHEALERAVRERGLSDVEVRRTGCHGFCSRGPVVVVEKTSSGEEPETVFYQRVEPGDVPDIVAHTLLRGDVVERLTYVGDDGKHVARLDQIPFFTRQKLVVLRNCGTIDPTDIDAFVARDGYVALARALGEMAPQKVIDEIVASGLRGRGGGGFSTGVKWGLTARQPGDKKYIVCNADEGDPGAFMDRGVLEGDTHAVLEGMIIGAYAMGADEGYVYCRAEYPTAIRHLHIAIAQAEALGLLGDDILGSGFNFHVNVKEGAGAFVCGEETALMASIEGKRGMPHPRPPFPAVSGLWGKPTNINNVETWANVAPIILKGAAWFASMGTDGSKGTKVFSLAGKVNNTGLVEVPMGVTLRELIFDVGGGITRNRHFKAVQMGGPSGGCLSEKHLDLPVDYDSLKLAGAIMGSGGVIVTDETTCMVDFARFFVNFTQAESCGKCVPCRLGTKRMLEILEKITRGEGELADIDRLERLANMVRTTSLCGLGQTAPNPVLSTIKYFRHEYEEHILEKKCSACQCEELVKAPCTHTCPAGVDTPSYLALVAAGQFEDAVAVHMERNPFPSICGADAVPSTEVVKPVAPLQSAKVAVVGAGPGGLSCAYQLALSGFPVTVFEALPVAGGMLQVGLPDFRMPKDVVAREVRAILHVGVELRTGQRLGRDFTIGSLLDDGYAAVFLAIGAHETKPLGVDGEDAEGVLPGVEFLRDVNLGGRPAVGRKVAVVGGGSVAMDAARTALRLQEMAGITRDVTLVYRRSQAEMPAYAWEVLEGDEEGLRFEYLVAPRRVLKDDHGHVRGLEGARMVLGEPDDSGRRRPVPVPGSEFVIDCDTVIPAIGQSVDLSWRDGEGIAVSEWGTIVADPFDYRTANPKVFAGGDVVRGPATLVEAIGDGQRAAFAIERFLTGRSSRQDALDELRRRRVPRAAGAAPDDAELPRVQPERVPAQERVRSFVEVVCNITDEQARCEASRCLRCDLEH
ncbi:MAG: NADH-ubiquinone oxidoreductase-F iron-sulfur binding region domain-containing protein [Thermoleophilia bacterium]